MIKKMTNFLQVLAILCIFNADAINKEALGYLEKLREKEYTALRKLCGISRMPRQEIEQIIQFYKDFKHIHAKKFFSEKNPDFFHDPKLAEFKMGDSNVLEETKKILQECGINPESISIRYKETHEKKRTLASVHCDVKNTEILKNLNSLTNNLNAANFHHELTIRTSLIQQGGFAFTHTIRHEIGHLLEGDPIMAKLLKNSQNYLGGDYLKKINIEMFEKFSKETGVKTSYIEKIIISMFLKELRKRYQYFKYRKEVLAEVRMYLESPNKESFLKILCAYYLWSHEFRKKIRPAWFFKINIRLTKFFSGNPWGTHPTSYSTYKRLLKINYLTWKIPSNEFEVSDDIIKEYMQEKQQKIKGNNNV